MKRLDTISSLAGTFDYTYHSGPTPLIARLSLPNTAYITNNYDSVARLSGTWLKNSSGTVLDSSSYHRTNGSPRLIHTTRHDGNKVVYEYDSTDQLKVARGQESGGSPRIHERFGYKYDAAGNLQNKTNHNLVQTFGHNNLNQITNYSRNSGGLVVAGAVWGNPSSVLVNGGGVTPYADNTFASEITYNDGTNSILVQAFDSAGRSAEDNVTVYHPAAMAFSYDANGNLLSDGRRHFTYDDENQLTQVVVTNTTKSIFAYDGKMRRRVRTECIWANNTWQTNEQVRYIYDSLLVIQERHFDPRLSTTVPISLVTYTRGMDISGSLQDAGGIGGLLARMEVSASADESAYYHADNVGNITAIVGAKQSLKAAYLYEPFGTFIASSGPMAAANVYRFSGKEVHEPSGLIYYPYRYLEPRLQRWITRDPILEKEGSLHLYAFIGNNSMERVDPFGLQEARPGGRRITLHDITQFIQNITPLGGRCRNRSGGTEWALVDGRWRQLPPGRSTGPFEDCDGMTCGGGFYAVFQLNAECISPGCDSPPNTNRRWEPGGGGDAGGRPPGGPGGRGSGQGDTPPDYRYGPRPPCACENPRSGANHSHR